MASVYLEGGRSAKKRKAEGRLTMDFETERQIERRERPITTEEYSGLAEAKKEEAQATRELAEIQLLMSISGRQDYNWEKEKKRLIVEMRDTPTTDIAAQVYSNMVTVEQMVKKAKNLNGTYMKTFETAARVTAVAVEELLLRTKRVTGETTEELRKENKVFKHQITELEKEVEELKTKWNCLNTKNQQGRARTVRKR